MCDKTLLIPVPKVRVKKLKKVSNKNLGNRALWETQDTSAASSHDFEDEIGTRSMDT